MIDYTTVIILMCAVSIITIISVIVGALIVLGVYTKNKKDSLDSTHEPVGDAFTIETPSDMAMFPEFEDDNNKAEEHILEKTNKFLQKFANDGGNTK